MSTGKPQFSTHKIDILHYSPLFRAASLLQQKKPSDFTLFCHKKVPPRREGSRSEPAEPYSAASAEPRAQHGPAHRARIKSCIRWPSVFPLPLLRRANQRRLRSFSCLPLDRPPGGYCPWSCSAAWAGRPCRCQRHTPPSGPAAPRYLREGQPFPHGAVFFDRRALFGYNTDILRLN